MEYWRAIKKNYAVIILAIFLLSCVAFPGNAELIDHDTNYDLIIVTSSCYCSSVEPLIEHKGNTCGIASILITLDDIYSEKYFEMQGRDDPEKIKYFIKEAKENWNITYVLLVGNFRKIPVRYCYNNDNYHSMEPRFISDLYYADIYDENGNFSSWDTDGNGIYGEWDGWESQDKNINLTPEICLGRLACRNRVEVKIAVDKIINYERTTYGSDWFKNMVVAGGDTYSEAREYYGDQYDEYEGEVNTQKAIDIMTNFTPIRLWASTGNLTTVALIKAINDGCGFLYLSGHGNPSVWVTHPPNSTAKVGNLPTLFMPFLINRNKLPICIVGGCHNSEFDVKPLNIIKDPISYSTWIPECWSWKMASKPFGGAIATIGCTGLGWQGIEYGGGGANWLNIQFFREYANGTDILGKIWKNTLTSYLEHFPIDWETPAGETSSLDAKTVQEWVLLGDPSLKIGGYAI